MKSFSERHRINFMDLTLRHNTCSLLLVLLLMIVLPKKSNADSGSCRYDEDYCSCRIGDSNQGICWDSHPTIENLCVKRYCRAGWTCSCLSRTHVCNVKRHSTHKLANPFADSSSTTASCLTAISSPQASTPELSLGNLHIHISRSGIASSSCSQFAWWHNGELLGNHGTLSSSASSVQINTGVAIREQHSLLELKHGDLIAFRFIDASYYCFKHFIELTINSTSYSSVSDQIANVMYTRGHSQDWYLPSLQLNQDNTGVDESESDLTKFLPLRTHKLSSKEQIVPGQDYWEPTTTDGSDPDHRQGNFYFRVQILKNM